jgi:hypothetical protein
LAGEADGEGRQFAEGKPARRSEGRHTGVSRFGGGIQNCAADQPPAPSQEIFALGQLH